MKIKSPNFQEWQRFVEKLPDHNFFQLPVWGQIHEKIYNDFKIKTRMYLFDDGVKILVPLLRKKITWGLNSYYSLPNGTYGGILWNKKPDEEQLSQVIKNLTRMNTLNISICPHPLQYKEMLFLEEYGFTSATLYVHILYLQNGFDNYWKNLSCKNRNQTRKAIKSGIEIRIGKNIEDIKSYYGLYVSSTKRWKINESRIRPFGFYEYLFQYGGDRVRFHLARKDGVDIAGAVIFYNAHSVIYWCGAMLKEYSEFCPNNLLHNEIIKDAFASDYKYYNMLGSTGLRGVEKFKDSFGCDKLIYKRFIYESFLLKAWRKIKGETT